MITPTLLATTLLPLLTPAFPLLAPRTPTPTQYEITALKTHFMGPNSGIASGAWPPGTAFNSTLSLTISYPPTTNASSPVFVAAAPLSATCTGSWPYGTHPTAWAPCAAEDRSVGWRFVEFETEGRFVVEVGRKTGEAAADIGKAIISSNNLADDSSWLTCLAGPPLDGVRCALDGVLSKQRAPIPVNVTEGPALDF